jgi:hypothetical protein
MGRMRGRRLSALVMAGLAMVALGIGASPAFGQANQSGGPAPITDYANYPLGLGIIPEGCTAQGPDVVEGEQFSVDGGAPVANMRDLGEVANDAVVTMTWTSFAPGCENVGITLSRKISITPAFNAADVQYLNSWSYCGPGGVPCTAPYSLTLDLRLAAPVHCYQLDANIGPPLNVVGPDTAYYSLNSQFNMLISAKNGGTEPCTPEPCPTNPMVPEASAECQEATTTTTPPTTPPPTTSTSAPAGTTTTTEAAPPPPGGQPTTSVTVCGANQQLDSTTGQCVAVLSQTGALPFTGSRSSDTARGGIAFVAAGLLMVMAAKRWRSASSTS